MRMVAGGVNRLSLPGGAKRPWDSRLLFANKVPLAASVAPVVPDRDRHMVRELLVLADFHHLGASRQFACRQVVATCTKCLPSWYDMKLLRCLGVALLCYIVSCFSSEKGLQWLPPPFESKTR